MRRSSSRMSRSSDSRSESVPDKFDINSLHPTGASIAI
jgi:hypothetical protein